MRELGLSPKMPNGTGRTKGNFSLAVSVVPATALTLYVVM